MDVGPAPNHVSATERALRSIGYDFMLQDRVRHVTQTEGKPGIVTGLTFREAGLIYLVTWSTSLESGHYGCELEIADDEPWAG